MILSKPNALVYVMRSGLVVAGRHLKQSRLNFPAEVMHNLEVVDPEKCIDLCQQFFIENGLAHKRVLIILDNSVVFRKNIRLDESGTPDLISQAFVAAMPFEEGQRACLNIQAENLLQLVAVNSHIYEAIAEALRAAGVAKLMGIIPVAAYDLTNTDRKLSSLVDQFLKGTDASHQSDFSKVQPL